MKTKQCAKCKKTKSTKEFYTNKRQAGGFDCYCRECRKEYTEANREKYYRPPNAVTPGDCKLVGNGSKGDALYLTELADELDLTTDFILNTLRKLGINPYPIKKAKYVLIARPLAEQLKKDVSRGAISVPDSGRQSATKATTEVAKAIKAGKLERPSHCEICGQEGREKQVMRWRKSTTIVAHHWRGHQYPLDVWFVCSSCNNTLHKRHDGSLTKAQARKLIKEWRKLKTDLQDIPADFDAFVSSLDKP